MFSYRFIHTAGGRCVPAVVGMTFSFRWADDMECLLPMTSHGLQRHVLSEVSYDLRYNRPLWWVMSRRGGSRNTGKPLRRTGSDDFHNLDLMEVCAHHGRLPVMKGDRFMF